MAGAVFGCGDQPNHGVTFSPPKAITAPEQGVCRSCEIGGVGLRAGPGIALLFRGEDATGERDMFFLSSADRGETYRLGRVEKESWVPDERPRSGACVAEASGAWLLAWETKGRVRYRRISGLGVAEPLRGPAATGFLQKFPAVGEDGEGNVLLAWVDVAIGQADGTLRYQLFDSTGRRVTDILQGPKLGPGERPSVAVMPGNHFLILY